MTSNSPVKSSGKSNNNNNNKEGASGISRLFGAAKLQSAPGADNPGILPGTN